MPFQFGDALAGFVRGVMDATVAEREAARQTEDAQLEQQIKIVEHLSDDPSASDELVAKALQDLITLSEARGAKTGSAKRPAKGAFKIGSELPISQVMQMIRQVDEGQRPVRGRTAPPTDVMRSLPQPPLPSIPDVPPVAAGIEGAAAATPPPPSPYTPHIRGAAGAEELPDVASELPLPAPPPPLPEVVPTPDDQAFMDEAGAMGLSPAQAMMAQNLPEPPTTEEMGRGLGPLFRSREEMAEQEARQQFMQSYAAASGRIRGEMETTMRFIQDPRTPESIRRDLLKIPQPKYSDIGQYVSSDGAPFIGYQVTTQRGPAIVDTTGEVQAQARPMTSGEQQVSTDVRAAAAEHGLYVSSIHELSPETLTYLRKYIESNDFDKNMRLDRAQAALSFDYYGKRKVSDELAARHREENQMLSPNEALTLGVPMGWTQGMAAAAGLIPRTSQQIGSAAAAASVVPELDRLERIIRGEEIDPRTGQVPALGLLEPPREGLAAAPAAAARKLPGGFGEFAGQFLDRTVVWARLNRQQLMNDPLYADFTRTIDGMIVTLAKSFGDAANIAILEAERIRNLFPKLGGIASLPDRQESAERMMAQLRDRVNRAIELSQDPQFNLQRGVTSPRERGTVDSLIRGAQDRYDRGVGVTSPTLNRYRQRRNR